jgi:hypothetical protein
MSKADTILKELGFKVNMLYYGDDDLLYVNSNDDNQVIHFDLNNKVYHTTQHYEGGLDISITLHNAIHEKLKELGWI